MKLFVVGLSHKTAPVAIRDEVAVNGEEFFQKMRALKELEALEEFFFLSTCNRTELYGLVKANTVSEKLPLDIYNNLYSDLSIDLNEHLYYFSGENTVQHLFKVASGLDSLALGEPQINGQVKDAYRHAQEFDTTGTVLNRLLPKTFYTTKAIRTRTQIGEGTTSIGFAAVEMANKIFGNLAPLKIMVIGAGETGQLTAGHFKKRGVSNFLIANRTFEKAEKLAEELEGTAIPFDKIEDHYQNVDAVVSCIGTQSFIVTHGAVATAMKARKNKPLFFIDLGAPRDIDPKTSDIYNVFVYDIDDLKEVIGANIEKRRSAVEDAERIIEEEAEEFLQWFSTVKVLPTIQLMQKHFEAIRINEIESNKKKLNETDLAKIDLLTKSIIKKLLKNPILFLKDNASSTEGALFSDSLRKIFKLEDDSNNGEDNA